MKLLPRQANKELATQSLSSSEQDRPRLRIAMCPPRFEPFQSAMRRGTADATHLMQAYIASGLRNRGHDLLFLTNDENLQIVCADHEENPTKAEQTWSRGSLFQLASRISWRTQKMVGVPYLNVFSNLRLYDASLQCLQDADLVYERNSLYRTGIARATRRLGLPYILHLDADDIMEYDIMGEPISGLLRWRAWGTAEHNFQRADLITCVSEQLKERLVSYWNVPSSKIAVIPNGADVNSFKPDSGASSAVRSELGIDGEPLVVFVGNFYQWHDVGTLLHAFSLVNSSFPEVQLILIGDGVHRTSMVQVSHDLGLEDNVHFAGLVPHAEVPRFLAAADIAVAPYPELETGMWLSPMKLYEYMASGLAIVATDTGQISGAIHAGQNGLLVPPGDVDGMAGALQRLIDDVELRLRLGNQAREDAVRQHSWDKYVSQLEDYMYQTYGAVNAQRQRA